MEGLVSQIQHGSTGDGPGLRTTVFLQGCSLRCGWCHNPETQSPRPQLLFYESRCARCRVCAAVCPAGAHRFADGVHIFDRSACRACGQCADLCPAGALRLSGRRMTTEEVFCEILADREFYASSGGGVTLSGGEPLLQPKFCRAVAQACKAAVSSGIHVLLDTAGDVPYAAFEQVLPAVDAVYFDFKTADAVDCKRYTGGNFDNILYNLTRVLASHPAVTVRVPLIPGVNTLPDKLSTIAERLAEAGAREVSLLPFHRLGSAKYAAMGLCYAYLEQPPLAREELQNACRFFAEKGFSATSDG